MATKNLQQFLRTYGRYREDGAHHQQRAGVFIFAILLVFSFSAHREELDALTSHLLAELGSNCTWCSITPY